MGENYSILFIRDLTHALEPLPVEAANGFLGATARYPWAEVVGAPTVRRRRASRPRYDRIVLQRRLARRRFATAHPTNAMATGDTVKVL